MAAPRPVRFVWTVHARIRELERVEDGICFPSLGSFVRLLALGQKADDHWVYMRNRCFIYGLVFNAPDYDVFLIRTVIPQPHTLWNAPCGVSLYHLENINEQGEEGSEAGKWRGYTYRSPAMSRNAVSSRSSSHFRKS
jgi:hypothetical protein